jgi:hypothetical protein
MLFFLSFSYYLIEFVSFGEDLFHVFIWLSFYFYVIVCLLTLRAILTHKREPKSTLLVSKSFPQGMSPGFPHFPSTIFMFTRRLRAALCVR